VTVPAGADGRVGAARPLRVIAAAVVASGRLLLVSKRGARDVWFLPGGKPDAGEPALDCLRRELHEELGVAIARVEPFAEVRARAALEGVAMHMSVFVAELRGAPVPAAEIAGVTWWPGPRALRLAPAVEEVVIPALRAAGRL
jgi:8-oxo-dGTP diphosphatase